MNTPASRRRRWILPVAILAGLAVIAGTGWYAWKTWGGGATQPEEYIFATVQRGDIEDLVGATGALQPREYVDVGAQVSGQLTKILVEVGSEVNKGDLLAEIDAEQSAARVEANRASLRAQQATLVEREVNYAKAERDLQRQKNLMAAEATTTELVQNAETLLRTSRAQINSLKAQIQQAQASMRVEEANLKYTKIYAPMSGTVVSITARQGQTLNTNQSAPTVLRIADLSTMTVQTQVSEADVSKLRQGMQSYFTTLGSQGRRWYGQLRKVEPTPTVTNNVVLYNALFDVPNPTKSLMTQMTAQVFFVAAEARDVLVVPMSALTMERTGGPRGGRAGQASRAASGVASAASGTTDMGAAAPGRTASSARAPGPRASGPAPGASVPRGGMDREAWSQMSDEARQRLRAERQAARIAQGASAPSGERRRPAVVESGMPTTPVARAPRRATVKVQTAAGSIEERQVTVGVSSRVSAEILSGLSEGDRVVAGVKVPDAPRRSGNPQTQGGLGQPGGGFGPGPGGARR